jgi:hypothetical protein
MVFSASGRVSHKTLSTVVTVVIVAIAIIYGAWKIYKGYKNAPSPSPTMVGLPDMPAKPKPQEIAFGSCPAEGDGKDPDLDLLKNRVDEGSYVPVAFSIVQQLSWPAGAERRVRSRWSASDTSAVEHYEGIPISIEGYLAGVKLEGPESTNCHASDNDLRDYHLWLTSTPNEDRSASIVVEATPRVRAKHPSWSITNLNHLVKEQQKVRISGWLMLDPEHPDQVGKTRGTIWEIHPIMKIEVENDGWQLLDSIK